MGNYKRNYGVVFVICFVASYLVVGISGRKRECKLPKDSGPCEAAMERYYFNYASRKCEKFQYGGCEGNDNNFESMMECQKHCYEDCEFPKYEGPCEAAMERYYYNSKSGKCETFLYGGCQANPNNFESSVECQLKCTNICLLPKDKGPCDSREKRYYFDKSRGICTIFNYGGCGGNLNNFMTMKDCQRNCRDMNPTCLKPEDRGEKVKYDIRWMYQIKESRCVPFVYNGKGGNDNRFMSQKECRENCPIDDVCKMEMEPGPCSMGLKRWHYDYIDDECKEFTYGGCLGNSNNFESEQECKNRCPEETDSICSMPIDRGTCEDWEPRFYYDQILKKCNLLIYGGCGGNQNNFFSMEECEERCPDRDEDVCQMPKDIGDGGKIKDRNVEPGERYYFDTKRQQCRYFQYSGSGGNGNNFKTVRECELNCPIKSRCVEPFMKGTKGGESDLRWFFNMETLECEFFIYEGAGGNRNNFNTKRECQNTCIHCDKDVDTGPCNGLFKRWAYDPSTQECTRFNYGGCEGNSNRFESSADCMEKCG